MRLGCRRRVWTRQPKTLTGLHVCVFAARVSFEGFGLRGLLGRRTAPVSVQGCFRVLVGTSEVGSRDPYEVLSLQLSFEGSGMRFLSKARIFVVSAPVPVLGLISCVSGPKTSPANPNRGPCSRRSRISNCVVCRKDGSLYIGL